MEMAAVVAFAGAFVVGINFAFIGSIKLRLADRLDIDNAKAGSLISALMFCCMIVLLVIGPLRDWLGYRAIAVPGFALAGICLWMLAGARTYKAAFTACLLLGVGTMAVSTTANVLAPEVLFGGDDPSAALNLVNVAYGIGAFFTPLVAAYTLRKLGYSMAVSIFGAIVFLPAIVALMSSYPEATGFGFAQYLEVLSSPVIWVAGVALFCYVGLEQVMGGFITTYLTDSDMSEGAAGSLLSAFWISLMVSRLAASFGLAGQTNTVSSIAVVVLSIAAVATIAFMVAAKAPFTSSLAVILTGLAFGPIFPTVMGLSLTQFPAEVGGSVVSLVFALGLLGGTVQPVVIGKYSDKLSIRQSLQIAVGVAAALAVVSGGLGLMVSA